MAGAFAPLESVGKVDLLSTAEDETGTDGVKFIQLSGERLQTRTQAISNVRMVPLAGPSRFVRPGSVEFFLNGQAKRWDMVESHESVSVIAFHKELQALLLVRQFRPAVYASEVRAALADSHISEVGNKVPLQELVPLERGFTYELCAGIVDKSGKDLNTIAREEIAEELGYSVEASSLATVCTGLSAVGISGARQTIFFAEVEEAMRISGGGGNPDEGEAIDVVALPLQHLDSFLTSNKIQKSSGVMLGAIWLRSYVQARRCEP